MLDSLNPLSDNFILKTLLNYINPFSEDFILNGVLELLQFLNPFSENFILKGVLDFLGNIVSYINPFSDNFLGKKIVEGIQGVLEYLFVPDTSEIDIRIESIKSKFSFIEDIKSIANQFSSIIQSTETSKSLTIDIPDNRTGINKLTIIDLSWYEKYKSYGDIIISCVVYIFFFWRVYVNLPNIINGVSSFSSDVASSTINLTKKGKGD